MSEIEKQLPVGSDALVLPLREWIGEIPCRAVKTVIVKARTFREAQQKIATGEDVEGIDVHYSNVGKGRILCEDRPRPSRQKS